ncbi:hypothetical protein ACFL04_01455 [Patescibacteria group bacterium]
MNFKLNFRISRKLINLYVKYSRYITIGVAVILVIVGYALLIGPKWNEIRLVGLNDYAREQRKLEDDKVYLGELEKLVTKYNGINQAILSDIDEVLPDRQDLPNLFVQMEALAIDAGATMSNISFSTTESEALSESVQLKVLDIDIELDGGNRYNEVKALLDIFERNKRILDLISISFSLEGTETVSLDKEVSGDYNLNLRTYYLDTAQAAAPTSEADLEELLKQLNQ